ncbi:MAG: membrane-fusion protein [Rhodospirillaceae bacterium]|nr:MAG: membrane-fusion protein [Rhodospirillaceae bacterium]
MAKCTVPAPFSGWVVEQKVQVQQFMQPGQALLDIPDDSVLEMVWLKLGHPFQVVPDEIGQTYPVQLARVQARIDPVSQTGGQDGRSPGRAFP